MRELFRRRRSHNPTRPLRAASFLPTPMTWSYAHRLTPAVSAAAAVVVAVVVAMVVFSWKFACALVRSFVRAVRHVSAVVRTVAFNGERPAPWIARRRARSIHNRNDYLPVTALPAPESMTPSTSGPLAGSVPQRSQAVKPPGGSHPGGHRHPVFANLTKRNGPAAHEVDFEGVVHLGHDWSGLQIRVENGTSVSLDQDCRKIQVAALTATEVTVPFTPEHQATIEQSELFRTTLLNIHGCNVKGRLYIEGRDVPTGAVDYCSLVADTGAEIEWSMLPYWTQHR